jgi:hypothetical protein
MIYKPYVGYIYISYIQMVDPLHFTRFTNGLDYILLYLMVYMVSRDTIRHVKFSVNYKMVLQSSRIRFSHKLVNYLLFVTLIMSCPDLT